MLLRPRIACVTNLSCMCVSRCHKQACFLIVRNFITGSFALRHERGILAVAILEKTGKHGQQVSFRLFPAHVLVHANICNCTYQNCVCWQAKLHAFPHGSTEIIFCEGRRNMWPRRCLHPPRSVRGQRGNIAMDVHRWHGSLCRSSGFHRWSMDMDSNWCARLSMENLGIAWDVQNIHWNLWRSIGIHGCAMSKISGVGLYTPLEACGCIVFEFP